MSGPSATASAITHGPGYRVYYKQTGRALVLILCGGDKSTQAKDIARAKAMAAEIGG
jgi:putative addiction module killer protein